MHWFSSLNLPHVLIRENIPVEPFYLETFLEPFFDAEPRTRIRNLFWDIYSKQTTRIDPFAGLLKKEAYYSSGQGTKKTVRSEEKQTKLSWISFFINS